MKRKTLAQAEAALEIALQQLAEIDRGLGEDPPSRIAMRRAPVVLRQIEDLRRMIARGRAQQTRAEAVKIKRTLTEGSSRSFIECESCSWSYQMPEATRVMHCHHVVPVARGGGNDSQNLVILCANCHAIAHILTEREHFATKVDLLTRLNTRPA